ncbi:MAG: hypothetical protein IT458_07090 [Planctomycetes bacterium]|nr:hypothetical protein [Planctomycetota bacterium]
MVLEPVARHGASRHRTAFRPAVWVVVLGAFVLTLWFAGPRAFAVVEARIRAGSAASRGPAVDLGLLAGLQPPQWLRDQPVLLRRILTDLEPALRGRIGVLDDEAAVTLRAALEQSGWVRSAQIVRVLPDQFEVHLDLRRPVLQVYVGDARLPAGHLDAGGAWLPGGGLDLGLPRTTVPVAPAASAGGAVHPDPILVAAAAVAVEYREVIAPLVPGAPALVEVDATNLGYRYLRSRDTYSEVEIALRRADGGAAWFAYGHPPGSAYPRTEPAVLAEVLGKVLAAHPGLAGIERGDLRLRNRWQDWLRPSVPAQGGRAPR